MKNNKSMLFLNVEPRVDGDLEKTLESMQEIADSTGVDTIFRHTDGTIYYISPGYPTKKLGKYFGDLQKLLKEQRKNNLE